MGRTVQMYLTRRKTDYFLSLCRPTAEQLESWPEDGATDAAGMPIDMVERMYAPLDLLTTAKILVTFTPAPSSGTFA